MADTYPNNKKDIDKIFAVDNYKLLGRRRKWLVYSLRRGRIISRTTRKELRVDTNKDGHTNIYRDTTTTIRK